MNMLFSPVSLDKLCLPNRIVVPPMCQYSAQDGKTTDWHMMHYSHLAFSGAGLVIVEATAVEPDGRISPQDLGLWSDDTAKAMKNVLQSIRKYSKTHIGVQLAHAGRKAGVSSPWQGDKQLKIADGGWQTKAPSPIPYRESDMTPAELSQEDINILIKSFADAAHRAVSIGYDMIEIHAAHGYLLHEFLSPLSNKRTDAYGGSLENRMRFPLEVFSTVRCVVPVGIPVTIRISGEDWMDGGWNIKESAIFCQELKKMGCAAIHVSSGGLHMKQKLRVGPGYQVALASHIKKETGLPVIAVGLITDPIQAESIIMAGDADMVAIGRGMLFNPHWGWQAAVALGGQVTAPPQYWRGAPQGASKIFGNK